MIEVPVFEFGHHAPVVAGEMGDGGPATAPGYALHGVWGVPGRDVVYCWEVRDDVVSLCAVSPGALQERLAPRPLRRIRFGGTVLPKPLLLSVAEAGYGAAPQASERLMACTSEGDIKIVPLQINENNQSIDVRPPFATVPLPHTHRVSACVFLPTTDNHTVLAFVGMSTWGQREQEGQAISEVKVVEVNPAGPEPESREVASLSFTAAFLRMRAKKVTAFTATVDPVTPHQYLVLTLQGTEAAVHSVAATGAVHEMLRFPVAEGDAVFSTDVTAVVSGTSLVVAFVQTRPVSAVLVFTVDFATRGRVAKEAPLLTPFPDGVPARASLRTTSTALYVVWQSDPPAGDAPAAVEVPLLFSHLPPEPAAPQFAISALPLDKAQSAPAAWRVVDFASTSQTRLRGPDASHDVGVCVIDGAALPSAADVCCVMRPGGLSVLRDADALETFHTVPLHPDLLSALGAGEDGGAPAPLDHPYVSFSTLPPQPLDDPALPIYSQLGELLSVVQAETVAQILFKILQPHASPDSVDTLANSLGEVKWLSHVDETAAVVRMLAMKVPAVLAAARQLLARAATLGAGVQPVPIGVLGAAVQLAFARLVAAVQASVVTSVARSLARGAVLAEAAAVFKEAVAQVVLHAHVYRILQYRTPPKLFAAIVAGPVTPAKVIAAVEDIARMLLAAAPVAAVPVANFMTALFGSPTVMHQHVRQVSLLAREGGGGTSAAFKRLVVSHAYANAIVLHSADAAGEFTATAEMLRHAPEAEQKAFIQYLTGLLPADSRPPWVGLDCVRNDLCAVYAYLAVRCLCHVHDELRKADDGEVLYGRGSALTLGQILRAAAVAVLPPLDALLSGMVLWTPADWDLVATVHAWACDDAVADARKAAHHAPLKQNPAAARDLCAKWDRAFRAVLGCVDPVRYEQQLATLVDAVLASGHVATQRFLTCTWPGPMASPIGVTIEPDANGRAVITVRLPPAGGASEAYRNARMASSKIAISVVSGPNGPGVGLVDTHDGVSQQVLGSVVLVGTHAAADRFQATVSVEMRGVTQAEARPVVVVVGFPGVPAQVLRCCVSAAAPLCVSPHHEHLASPAAAISRLLWARGNDKSIHELIANQRVPNYYEFLAQFLLQRGQYKAAARVTYRIAERIRNARCATLQDQAVSASALCLAKSMLVMGGATSFGLTGDDPAKCVVRGEPQADPNSPERVTLEALEHKRISVEAEAELLRRETAMNPGMPVQSHQYTSDETLRLLSKRRALIQAASYGAAWEMDLTPVFAEGVAACLEAEAAAGMGARQKKALWAEVLGLLDRYSTAAVQWQYHVVALRAVLAAGAPPPARVLDPLEKHRPDTVIREAVAAHTPATLALAARLATRYQAWVLAKQTQAAPASDAFAPAAAVPPTLLDTLAGAVAEGAARPDGGELAEVAAGLSRYWPRKP
eukprot:TRINITY_DN18312_c0_g1_i2.p1 TRINITY_DN18312_c0_g1~~TRINITY_DN18312_c0_g1_i2.p1  ORF type:complete len:1430 (+),score=513.82 TRINITY_DN18312_c0_g1_i2:58-4347(+)